jgi:hypothetical protein
VTAPSSRINTQSASHHVVYFQPDEEKNGISFFCITFYTHISGQAIFFLHRKHAIIPCLSDRDVVGADAKWSIPVTCSQSTDVASPILIS